MRDRGDEKDLNDTLESFVGNACKAAVLEEKLNELLAYVGELEECLGQWMAVYTHMGCNAKRPECLHRDAVSFDTSDY